MQPYQQQHYCMQLKYSGCIILLVGKTDACSAFWQEAEIWETTIQDQEIMEVSLTHLPPADSQLQTDFVDHGQSWEPGDGATVLASLLLSPCVGIGILSTDVHAAAANSKPLTFLSVLSTTCKLSIF